MQAQEKAITHFGDRRVLRSLIDSTPRTEALKSGQVRSDIVEFEFDEVVPVTDGFPAMVREMRYDFGELALVTLLQAKAAGKGLTLLPFVLVGEFLQPHVIYNSKFGSLDPHHLAGRRIGIRSYTQTSGVWIRGILEEDYGIELSQQRWVTLQDPHVLEYKEPSFVERAPPGSSLLQMLLDGTIDAALGVGPAARKYPQLAPLFPADAAETWSRRRNLFPINHMAVVRSSLHEMRPDITVELFRLLLESKQLAKMAAGEIDTRPYGLEANRRSMNLLVEWAVRQQLLSARIDVDSLFDATTAQLGVEPHGL